MSREPRPGRGAEDLYAFVDRLAERYQKPEEEPETLEEWLLFESGGRSLCLPVDSVIEVVRLRPVTRVPGAPAPVRGLVNLRGRPLPLLDLGLHLGLGASSGGSEARIVVLESRGRRIGALVDRAHTLVKIAPSAVQEADEASAPIPPRLVRGVHRTGDDPWVLLESDALLSTAEPSPT